MTNNTQFLELIKFIGLHPTLRFQDILELLITLCQTSLNETLVKVTCTLITTNSQKR